MFVMTNLTAKRDKSIGELNTTQMLHLKPLLDAMFTTFTNFSESVQAALRRFLLWRVSAKKLL